MLEGFRPTVLRVFGGLCTFIDRIALELGLSPDCKNVRFAPGMVATRDGYGVYSVDGGEWITGIGQLVRPNGDKHLITLSYGGRLKDEFPRGTRTQLIDLLAADAGMVSSSLFGTLYMCFSDGRLGVQPMHRYDGVALSLIGAGAPGKAPVLNESATASGGTGLLAGVHSCAVVFVNKAGDISGWSPVHSDTFVGGKKTEVAVPLGPPDTAQRIVAITPANDARSFMYTPKMVVNENTTATAITFDISEEELLNSQLSITRWLTSFVPWMPAGCFAHQERVLVTGSRATLQPGILFDPTISTTQLQNIGLRNFAFDGGFDGNVPNGWTASGTGQQKGGSLGTPTYGKCYRMGGDAVSLSRGKITQAFRNDASFMRPQARYGVAVLMRSPLGTPGDLHVNFIGAITGATPFLAAVFPAGTDADARWVSATYEMAAPLAADEVSITVEVYWSGSVAMGATNFVDCKLAVYDADDLQHIHTFYASDSGKPGTFVGETCAVSVGPDDGEGIRVIFRLRDNLFIAKERSMHGLSSTTDGEPTTWRVNLVDPLAGTPSQWGVSADDSAAIIASRDAALRFDGASSTPISREIEALWRGADWNRGDRAIVVVDRAKEIVRFALPRTTDIEGASLLLTLDYKEGWASPVPSGNGMKWSRDTFTGPPVPGQEVAVVAAARILSDGGVSVPLLSAYGPPAINHVSPSTFSSPTWTFPGVAPTVTAGQADGNGGTLATRWAFTAGVHSASVVLPASVTRAGVPVFSLRVKPDAAITVTATHQNGESYSFSLVASSWQRIVAPFLSGNDTGGQAVTLTFVGLVAEVVLASLQVDYDPFGGDWGFSGSAGLNNPAISALLFTPVDGLRRDFSGNINFLYETAPFGEDVGRSTFDRCVVRAIGDGYLGASYKGTGTRSWPMTSVQLTSDADEDVEFGADLKAPAASLILTNTSDNGWVTIKRVAVAAKGELIGWLRGRN